MFDHIFYTAVILGIFFIGFYIYAKWEETKDKQNQRFYEGKYYRYMCVGMDVNRGFQDTIQSTIGNISKSELKRRDKSGAYSINAWVQVGLPTYSWKEEPINRETWLCYAGKYERLPKYLQEESGCVTIEQYREKMKEKATG